MALNKDFPQSPYAILDPEIRWFPADEALRESSSEKLMPPLVPQLRKRAKVWRDSGYVGATETSRSLLNWWFNTPHLLPQAYLPSPFGRGAGGEGVCNHSSSASFSNANFFTCQGLNCATSRPGMRPFISTPMRPCSMRSTCPISWKSEISAPC